MAVKKKPLIGDVTRTKRANSFLERLAESGGKRVVVDFDAEAVKALQKLIKSGYADTQKDAIQKAVKSEAKGLK